MAITSILVFNRQGKIRLKKWYKTYSQQKKSKFVDEIIALVLRRKPTMSNIVEWKDEKVIYKRYASLFFCASITPDENELIVLEILHQYVLALDKIFENVCELDLIYEFNIAYYVLDEILIAGEFQETGVKTVVRHIHNAHSREAMELLEMMSSS